MVTLYSFGPGANSLKPLLALYEKGIEFTSRFLNPATFEHHSDWFKEINPAGSFGRAQMRIWTKWVDEYFCWCVSTIGWHRMVGGMVRHLGDEEFEKMVERPWLAGEQYTLADICNFAIANGMHSGFADLVNESETPHLVTWIHRINERPACKLMFAKQPSEWQNRRRE